MLEIYINDKEVGVSNDYGPWHTEKLNNQWLWILGVIKNGTRIKINDCRSELQPHQQSVCCTRGITTTNHILLKKLLDVYSPEQRGVLLTDEIRLVNDGLLLKERTVIDLKNLRDFVVAAMGGSDDIEDWDRMSAITHCIDMELVSRGAEV